MKATNWNKLKEAIGVILVTSATFQMTAEGYEKIDEVKTEYFGPLAMCNAGGRPVLSATALSQHSVGTGDTDVIWNPLYDSISYPSAGQLAFSFYSNPIGQGTTSTPGAGANPKTIYDTNLTIGNQLTSGNEFYMIGSESNLMPGVSNANLPLTVLPGRANVPTTVGIFANDVWSVGAGGYKKMTVGTDRNYLQDGPLNLFPPTARLAGFSALANESSTTGAGAGMEVTYAVWSGETYTVVPIYIQSNQNWTMVVSFAALIPTPSTQIARLQDRMRGYLIRQAT
jgi:hypothetical protein